MGKVKGLKRKGAGTLPIKQRKAGRVSKKISSLKGMVVSESEIQYARGASFIGAQALKAILFKGNTRPEYLLTSLEKSQLVEGGISKKDLERLKEYTALDYDQLSKVLNVARATLLNKKGNDTFSSDVSDKILNLADIYSYGYEVFEDKDKFNGWVFKSNKALGGQSPFELLHNSFGRQEVRHLIGRIDHGVYS